MTDEPDIGLGPRLLAIEAAVRALIDQASFDDPELRQRIQDATEQRLASIPLLSELEAKFIERARACVQSIMRPPTV